MAITNHERVGKALELLKTGLARQAPFTVAPGTDDLFEQGEN